MTEQDSRFDLSIWRSSQDRIKMVIDPDCPRDILEIVITHDLDDDVIFSTLIAKNVDDNLVALVQDKYNLSDAEITKKQEILKLRQTDLRSKVFCVVPWNHVSTTANGTIRMCCQMINSDRLAGEEHYGTVFKDNGNVLTTSDNITTNRNAHAWKKIRKEMLVGKRPAICKLCWDEEDNGIGSKREWTNNTFSELFDTAIEKTEADGSIKHEDFPIEHWDLRFGNKCNLACRSCGPTDSNMWYKDWVALQENNTFYNRGIGDITIDIDKNGKATVDPSIFEWYNQSAILDHLHKNIKSVKRFYFTGGEPTINHTHRKLLDFVIDEGLAKDISLDYNTNMAGVPNAIFEQWKHFKEVNLGMSIDGIYEHFEYIRHPGKWSAVEKNMLRIDNEVGFDNVKAGITMTVSIMNVLHILDMQWWMKEQNWNRIDETIIVHNLYGPVHLNTQNFSNEMKQYITDRYQKFLNDIKRRWVNDHAWYNIVETRLNSILTHMNSVEQNLDNWKSFFYTTEKLDKIRKENWKISLPEIRIMIEYCNGLEARKKNVKLVRAGKK